MEADKLNKLGHNHSLADVTLNSLRPHWEGAQAAGGGGSGPSRICGASGSSVPRALAAWVVPRGSELAAPPPGGFGCHG